MECIEARALKSSFLSETRTQQPCFEDMWCVTGFNNVPCDDFSVDDLLDLSDKDFKFASLEKDEENSSLSFSSHHPLHQHNSISTSTTGDFDSLSAAELPLPVDDLDSLEWLSQFVDDSMSETSLLIPAGNWKEKTGKFFVNRNQPAKQMPVQKFSVLLFSSPVPKKVRTKRARPGRGVWSVGSLSFTELSSSSSSSSSFTSPLMLRSPVQVSESLFTFEKPPAKKQRKSPGEQTGSVLGGFQTQRRCSHCHVQKTPQWRTGPFGPKTLCNACGVRFKSGRLYPEYRPACSPTFSCDVHSNSHRKVLEMRRKKEVIDSVLTPAVQSF